MSHFRDSFTAREVCEGMLTETTVNHGDLRSVESKL